MRRSTILPALVAAAGALAIGGCGDEEQTPNATRGTTPMSYDERRAGQRVEEFLAAMAAGDDAGACALMTPKLRRAITTTLRTDSLSGTCRTRAADIHSPAKAPGNAGATVAAVHVDGSSATATVTAEPEDELATGAVESDVLLELRGSRWLIANF